MRHRVIVFPVILALIVFASCQKRAEIVPVRIIFDTDLGPDYDDVGALAMLHAYADSGLANILATIASNRYELTGPCIEIINTYFGRPDIPVGTPPPGSVRIGCSQHWTDSLVAKYTHSLDSTGMAEDAVTLYRRILSAQPDTSVTIVTVGFLTNIRNLLLSRPDTISQLSGEELVKQKVKQWVAMAGKFPSGSEFNIMMDSMASIEAISRFPRPIIFTGFEIGEKIKTGKKLVELGDPQSPVREVFRIALPLDPADRNGRMSWDETAVLIAVKGIHPYFEAKRGKFIPFPNGYNEWYDDGSGSHAYVTFALPPDSIGKIIENTMMHKPVKKLQPVP